MGNSDFKIKFKGQEITVKQVCEGTFDVDLSPSERKLCYLSISRMKDKWALLDSRGSTVLCVDLYDDGTVKYKEAGKPDEERTEAKLNPQEKLKDTELDNALRTILEFETAMFSQKGEVDISAEKIIAARKALLRTSLRMLGFNSYRDVLTGDRQPIVYVGLKKVVEQFLSCQSIDFVKNISNYDGSKIIMARLPNNMSPVQARGLVNGTIVVSTHNNEHTKFVDDLVMRNRDISPDFMAKMKKRFDVSGRYSDAVRQLALLFLTSNADLLPEDERSMILKIRERLAAGASQLPEQIDSSLDSLEKRILFSNRQLFEAAFAAEESYAQSELNNVRNMIPEWSKKIEESGMGEKFVSRNVAEITQINGEFEDYLRKQKETNPFDKVQKRSLKEQTLE